MANTKGQALIDEITAEYIKNDTPDFRPGDNVKVFVKIQEGDHTRLQAFEGLVIKRQGHGVSATFVTKTLEVAFTSRKIGMASAMGVVLLIMILIITFVQKRFFDGGGEE